jgi:hypothetical protein
VRSRLISKTCTGAIGEPCTFDVTTEEWTEKSDVTQSDQVEISPAEALTS